MTQQKVFVIGGATLDTIITYEEMETLIHERQGFTQSYLLLEEGKKIEVLAQHSRSGGGATNAAVSFKRQGYDVDLFCKLGRDIAGEIILQELKSYGLSIESILFDEKIGTATSFVVPSLKGDRTVFAYRGANAHLLTADLPLSKIENAAFLYITSLSQASAVHLPAIVEAASRFQVKVAVNPGMSQLKEGASYLKNSLKSIDTLILNEEEAKAFMVSLLQDEALTAIPTKTGGQSKKSSDFSSDYRGNESAVNKLSEKAGHFSLSHFNLWGFFKKVLSLGPHVVAVTNGAEGVYVATRDQLYFHKAPALKVVNTLGAGDAFGSGFTGSWYRNYDLAQSIRAGILNSASVIEYSDAKQGLLTEAEYEAKLRDLPENLLIPMDW